MKKIITTVLLAVLAMLCCLQVYAAGGNVTYEGNASGIVFAPGSDQSLTDLFPNFKGIMPGDTLTQTVTLKNGAPSGTRIDVFMRAQSIDEASKELLSLLTLHVTVKNEQNVKEIFHAAPSATTGLEGWIFLGTLEAGGEVDLELSLRVPLEMDNEMQGKLGSLKWDFRTNDFSVGRSERTIFHNPLFTVWLVIAIAAVAMFVRILCRDKLGEEPEEEEIVTPDDEEALEALGNAEEEVDASDDENENEEAVTSGEKEEELKEE